MFTARYGLNPYTTQTRCVFKGYSVLDCSSFCVCVLRVISVYFNGFAFKSQLIGFAHLINLSAQEFFFSFSTPVYKM